MQKTLNYIVENEELNQKLMSAKTFEEVYDLFKSVKPDITEEEFENFFIDFFKDIENYSAEETEKLLGIESLDQENLEKVSGGKISQRVISATLASLVLAPSVGVKAAPNVTAKGANAITVSSKASDEKDSIKSKISQKFGKLKNWFTSLPLWGKITIPTALSIPPIGAIIYKVFGNKKEADIPKNVKPPILTPVNEITEENLKDKIEELLNSRQTTNDDIDGLCDKIELAGLRDKAFDIVYNWFKNGEEDGTYDFIRCGNPRAQHMVNYFMAKGDSNFDRISRTCPSPTPGMVEKFMQPTIEEFLDSEQTTNDEIGDLCEILELAGLQDKVYDIMDAWFKNGGGKFVREKVTNENANAIVKYFATHGTEEQKGKYAELQRRLKDFVNPPAPDPKADEITKENLAIKIDELLSAEYTNEATYKTAAGELCKKILDANDTDLMNEAHRILKEKFENSGENAEIKDRVKHIIEYFAQNCPENMRSNFSDLLLPKDPPPVPSQDPTISGITVERDFKDLTADNAWSVIETFLNSPAKENPQDEADYLKEATNLRDSIETSGAVNKIRETIYNNLLGWFKNGASEKGEFDFNRASDARARYLVGYFANAGQEVGREQYKELDSQLNQYILIERLTDQTQSGDEKSGAERLIKLLALARLGNAKVVNAKYDSSFNRNGDHDEANRTANDFKVYSGYLTDLFAYGNTVVFDYNTNVQTQLTDLGHILDDNYESSGDAELSGHDLILTLDGRIKEIKLGLKGQVRKIAGKVAGNAMGSNLSMNIIPNGDCKNTLKSLVKRLSDTKSGMFAKLEVVENQKTSKYGYKHGTESTSERITATAAARDFAPFAKRDGIHVEFDKLTVGEIKRAVDEWYKEYTQVDVNKKKELLRKLTDPTADGAAARERAFPSFKDDLNRSEAKAKLARVHKVDLSEKVKLVLFKYDDGQYSFWLEGDCADVELSREVLYAKNAKITEQTMQRVINELKKAFNETIGKTIDINIEAMSNPGSFYEVYSDEIPAEFRNQAANSEKFKNLGSEFFTMLRKNDGNGRGLYHFSFNKAFYERFADKLDTTCEWANEGLKSLIEVGIPRTVITWRDVFEDSKEWWYLNPNDSLSKIGISEEADTLKLLAVDSEVQREMLNFIKINSASDHANQLNIPVDTSNPDIKHFPISGWERDELGATGLPENDDTIRMYSCPQLQKDTKGAAIDEKDFAWAGANGKSVAEKMIRRIYWMKTKINISDKNSLPKTFGDKAAGIMAGAAKGVGGAIKGVGGFITGLWGGKKK